jgi:hypothetical protein
MKEAISDLGELDRDFTLITDQIVKHLQQISKESNESRLSMRRPAKSLNILQPYHRVRYASNALYATLQGRWNYSTHQYHFFDMRIIEYDHKKENWKTEVTRSRYVTCELAVTHDEIISSSSKGPLHLEIQLACDSDDEELEQGVGDSTSIQRLTKVLEPNADRLQMQVSAGGKSTAQKFLDRFQREKTKPSVFIDVTPTPQLPGLGQSLSDLHLDDQSTQPSASFSS